MLWLVVVGTELVANKLLVVAAAFVEVHISEWLVVLSPKNCTAVAEEVILVCMSALVIIVVSKLIEMSVVIVLHTVNVRLNTQGNNRKELLGSLSWNHRIF